MKKWIFYGVASLAVIGGACLLIEREYRRAARYEKLSHELVDNLIKVMM